MLHIGVIQIKSTYPGAIELIAGLPDGVGILQTKKP
jgi:hypothetical protein